MKSHILFFFFAWEIPKSIGRNVVTNKVLLNTSWCEENLWLIRIIIIIIFYRKLHAVYITIDGCHYVWHKVQTATLHYTREPADWLTLTPDTGMLTHLPLRDSGTRLQRHSLPRTSMFVVSWAWVRPCSSLLFVQYGLDRGGWLSLILGHCRCVG